MSQKLISSFSILLPASAPSHSMIYNLIHQEAGSSSIEYGMVLAMVALGSAAILGGVTNLCASFVQYMVGTVSAAWPA